MFNIMIGPCAVHRYEFDKEEGRTICMRCGEPISERLKKHVGIQSGPCNR